MRNMLIIAGFFMFGLCLVACGGDGASDCEDFCGKAEECLGSDNMDELGGVEDCVNGCSGNTSDWKECMLNCNTSIACEDWANCVNSCGGFTIPDGDED